MRKFHTAVLAFWSDQRAVTAIEYGLIAALVGIALIVGATALGTKLSESFAFIATLIRTS